PEDERQVLRREVRAQGALLLGAFDDLPQQWAHPRAHLLGPAGALLPAPEHVLDTAVAGMQLDGLLDEGREAEPGVLYRGALLGQTDDLRERLLEHGVDQLVLRREVPVEGP